MDFAIAGQAKHQESLDSTAQANRLHDQSVQKSWTPCRVHFFTDCCIVNGYRRFGFLCAPVRTVPLERRQTANLGPATVGDIYDALVAGGYKFEAKNDDYAKRGLYQALTKNVAMFHRLPNNMYGLLAWYPNVKAQKVKKAEVEADGDAAGGVAVAVATETMEEGGLPDEIAEETAGISSEDAVSTRMRRRPK